MSEAEAIARSRTLKGNAELAAAFGITPGVREERETVKVDYLPDPPATEVVQRIESQRGNVVTQSLDEVVLNILAEEMDEMGTRLEKFGVRFDSRMRQEMVDHAMAMLGGGFMAGGGAIARR